MPPLLELENVTKRFGGGPFRAPPPPALADVSLRFDAEEPRILAVVGESGSGKTTLAQMLLGFLAPSEGRVLYEGRPLGALDGSARARFRRDVQAILQDPFSAFNPFYTVDHALTVPLSRFGLARGAGEQRRRMRAACEQVGLNPDDTLGRYPHQLSGGQRQRLMVARALMLAPRVIVADEPVSMVDASLRATILQNVAHGISVVYITHDLTTAYHVADDVVVLYKGRVVEAGDAAGVLTDPQHPYTQLLIDSVPWPDLDRRWGQRPLVSATASERADAHGCSFRQRCPEALPVCGAARPPLLAVGPAHQAACHRRGVAEASVPAGAMRAAS